MMAAMMMEILLMALVNDDGGNVYDVGDDVGGDSAYEGNVYDGCNDDE